MIGQILLFTIIGISLFFALGGPNGEGELGKLILSLGIIFLGFLDYSDTDERR